jgi:putative intracellular protease/amidase
MLIGFEHSNKLIAAMCAGTTVLHAADIGKGKRATSYPLFKGRVEGHFEYQEEDVVVHDKLITSRGPATAMLWAVTIVKELCGVEKAKEISSQMLLKTSW